MTHQYLLEHDLGNRSQPVTNMMELSLIFSGGPMRLLIPFYRIGQLNARETNFRGLADWRKVCLIN